jgi:hypothetical protein
MDIGFDAVPMALHDLLELTLVCCRRDRARRRVIGQLLGLAPLISVLGGCNKDPSDEPHAGSAQSLASVASRRAEPSRAEPEETASSGSSEALATAAPHAPERCDELIAHNLELRRRAQTQRSSGQGSQHIDLILLESCRKDPWPAGAMDCLVAATDMDAWSACIVPELHDIYFARWRDSIAGE